MSRNPAVRVIGFVLTVGCIVFLVSSLAKIDLDPFSRLPRLQLVLVIAAAACAYTALLMAVATGFAALVRATGHPSATGEQGIAVWGRANLAKYLPGNVMHFAGRQWLALRFHWPQASTAAASVLELALQVLMSCTIGLAGLLLSHRLQLAAISAWLLPAVLFSLTVLAIAFLGELKAARLPAVARHVLMALALRDLRPFAGAVVLYGTFFLGFGLIGWLVYSWLLDAIEPTLLPGVVAVVLVSWCAGLVVPGSPGGLGVREATMVLLGAPFLDHGALVLTALLLRISGTAGEALLFALACHLPRRRRPPAPDPLPATPAGGGGAEPSVAVLE